MKLLVLHLSDIHFRAGTNTASERLKMVPPAVQNLDANVATVLVVASGDIAFSGKRDEYTAAQGDIAALMAGLRARFMEAAVHFVAVPGNHDCDFTVDATQTRGLLLQALTRGANPPPDDTTLKLCCTVHEHFFAFLEATQTLAPSCFRERVYYEYLIPVGDGCVHVRCFNTAFASTKPENPGHMIYPTHLLLPPNINPPPLYTIAAFHHPYNWLTPETKHQFGGHIEQTADLILTGHEHRAAYYRKETSSDLASDYIEGAAFQEHDDLNECGFNAMVIDLSIAQERILEFKWDTDHFSSHDQSTGWRPYRRSKAQREFELTERMQQRLEDPGAAFSHPAKPRLVLEDIFVAPNAEELTIKNGKDIVKSGLIESRKFMTTIVDRKRVLITGRERSGKSTLAKMLFRHFYYHGFVPVLIEGDHIKSDHAGEDLSKFCDLVHRRVRDDYKNPLLDKFDQLDRDRVVLIVDDFDHARLNARGRLKLLELLHRRFSRIVILGDDFLRIEELAYKDMGAKLLHDYGQFSLKEYGHVLRSAIIDKWYDVNREYATNPDLLAQNVARAERLIDDIMRRSYLPSFPIFILTILQGLDIAQPIDAAAGSYGYLYQVLITDRLVKTAPEISLDKKLAYLTELAHFMFGRDQRELSEVDFQVFHSSYCQEYIGIDRAKMFGALDEAAILEIYDKHYRFKYAYFYYYFVAQYFSRNLEAETVRRSVVGLCAALESEENANIWLFLTHQSRSDFLLDTIAAHAKQFFVDTATPAFGDDIKFLQELYDRVPEMVMVDKSPEQMRQERRKQLDDEPKDVIAASNNGDTAEDNEIVRTVVRLRAAIRTLEVMGQIVKNFAGSMKSDPRFTLVKGCYELGLRVVGVILGGWQRDSDSLVRELLDMVLQKDTNIENREELAKTVKSCIFHFCELIASGMVKRIAQAVGTRDLVDTYRQVLDENPTNAYRLIDVAVKLDNVGFPTGDILALNARFGENVFCHRLLCRLVIDHFYLFVTSDKTKQQVCSKLGIKMRQLRGIDVRTSGQKRLPSA